MLFIYTAGWMEVDSSDDKKKPCRPKLCIKYVWIQILTTSAEYSQENGSKIGSLDGGGYKPWSLVIILPPASSATSALCTNPLPQAYFLHFITIGWGRDRLDYFSLNWFLPTGRAGQGKVGDQTEFLVTHFSILIPLTDCLPGIWVTRRWQFKSCFSIYLL